MSVRPRIPKLLWREVPLFIVFAFMSAGMLVARLVEMDFGGWLAPFCASMVLALICMTRGLIRWRIAVVGLMSFTAGAAIYAGDYQRMAGLSLEPGPDGLTTRVEHCHRSAAGNAIAHLAAVGHNRAGRLVAVILDKEIELAAGDTIRVFERPERITSPENTFEFDPAVYYRTMGISHRVFLRPGTFLHKKARVARWRSPELLRNAIITRIDHYIADTGSASILKAMLFGERSTLAASTRRIYTASGAMHILAISGLHIGIIASLLFLIFGNPLRMAARWKSIVAGCAIAGILWLYVWLVDMPPSATRAAGMVSLYIAGGILQRRSHPLNILSTTGVIALVINPMLIDAVGFQFSYLALLGILLVGLPLYRQINFRSPVISYFWATVAISIGAQFFLLPLLAYYFHEVATMSVISSLFAIPAAYVIVGSGILLTISAFILPTVAAAIGPMLNAFIQLLTKGLQVIASSGWSTIPKLYLTAPETVLLLLLLGAVGMRIAAGQVFWIRPLTPLALAFLILHSITYVTTIRTPALTFYVAGERPAFEFIHRGTSLYHGLDRLSTYDAQNVRVNRLSKYVRESRALPFPTGTSAIQQIAVGNTIYRVNPDITPLQIQLK